MQVTGKDARRLACPYNNFEACLGSECMGWVWGEVLYECPTCLVRYEHAGDAEACHGRLHNRYLKGFCGVAANHG